MNSFIERWHKVREEKGSNIVAGLDPAIFEMGRGDKGLAQGVDLLQWSIGFIDAVAPYVVAIKPNQAYFQAVEQREVLRQVVERIREHGLLSISDNKIADIGSTNDAWAYHNATLGFDALTCAPYAGNLEETVASIHTYGMGAITMGLMSNPEYRTQLAYEDPTNGEKLWERRIKDAIECGADGIVVGGTYTKDDPAFTKCVELTKESDMLYLVPGIGAQGGEVKDFLASGIDPKRCMINSGRAVMFPNGSNSTPEEQAVAAKELRDAFNEVANLE